jgi:hypothetical protein
MSNSKSLSNAASSIAILALSLMSSCSRDHSVWPVEDGPTCSDSCPLFVHVDILGRGFANQTRLVDDCSSGCLDGLMSWRRVAAKPFEAIDVGGSPFTPAGLVFDLGRDAAELAPRVGFCADAVRGHGCRDRVWVFETAAITGQREPPAQLSRALRLDKSGEVWLDGESIGACRLNNDTECARAVSQVKIQFDDQRVVLGADMFANWGDVATLLRALHPIRRHVWALRQWDSLEQRLDELRPGR